MNYLKSTSTKSKMEEHSIGLPISRDIRILAHIWPTDKTSMKDVRFDFYGKAPFMEIEIISKLLSTYGTGTHINPGNYHTKSLIPNPLVPLLQKKLEEQGLNVRWITVKM